MFFAFYLENDSRIVKLFSVRERRLKDRENPTLNLSVNYPYNEILLYS
jgi:hypothetical protein